MVSRQSGSETLQIALALPLLFFVATTCMQGIIVAYSGLAIGACSENVCEELDPAKVKSGTISEEDVARLIGENSLALATSNITISNLTADSEDTSETSTIERQQEIEGALSVSSFSKSLTETKVDFDVAYRVPMFFCIPLVDHQVIRRHISHTQAEDMNVEVG